MNSETLTGPLDECAYCGELIGTHDSNWLAECERSHRELMAEMLS